jgi:hypothetical protein
MSAPPTIVPCRNGTFERQCPVTSDLRDNKRGIQALCGIAVAGDRPQLPKLRSDGADKRQPERRN